MHKLNNDRFYIHRHILETGWFMYLPTSYPKSPFMGAIQPWVNHSYKPVQRSGFSPPAKSNIENLVQVSNPLGIPAFGKTLFPDSSPTQSQYNTKPAPPDFGKSATVSDAPTSGQATDKTFGASEQPVTGSGGDPASSTDDFKKNDEIIKKGPGDQGQTQKCGAFSAGAAAGNDGDKAASKLSDDIEGMQPEEIKEAALKEGAKSANLKNANPDDVQKSLDNGKRVVVLNNDQQHAYTLVKGSDGQVYKLNSQGNEVTKADIQKELQGANQVVDIKAA